MNSDFTWTCPECSRHVPNRLNTCRCGYQRLNEFKATPVHDREVEFRSNKLKKEDGPGLSLISVVLSVLLFGYAWLLMSGWKLDFEEKEDLYRVSGVVDAFSRTSNPNAGRKMHIYLSAGNHLTQDDLTSSNPALLTLKTGDNITALVASDSLGRNLEWVWEVERDQEMVLTYEATLAAMMRTRETGYPVGQVVAYGAFFLLILGIFLRIKSGAWTS